MTRQEIGRMTINDLMLLARKSAPEETGGGGKGQITTQQQFEEHMKQLDEEVNSWLSL